MILQKLQVTNTQIDFQPTVSTTPAQPSHTSQTGIPHRSDRSGLCATQVQKSGVSGRIVGVSGLPSPENPDLYPVCLSHPKPGVSGQMAGLSGALPVRPVFPT